MSNLLRWFVAPLALAVTGYSLAHAPMPYLVIGIAALCTSVIAIFVSFRL